MTTANSRFLETKASKGTECSDHGDMSIPLETQVTLIAKRALLLYLVIVSATLPKGSNSKHVHDSLEQKQMESQKKKKRRLASNSHIFLPSLFLFQTEHKYER